MTNFICSLPMTKNFNLVTTWERYWKMLCVSLCYATIQFATICDSSSFTTMFCHFYNQSSFISIYYISYDYGVTNLQLLSFTSFRVDQLLSFSSKKSTKRKIMFCNLSLAIKITFCNYFATLCLSISLVVKVITTWLLLCDVHIPLMYIKVFWNILRVYLYIMNLIISYLRHIKYINYIYYGHVS